MGIDPPGKVVSVKHGDRRVFAGMPFLCKPPAPETAAQEPVAAQCAHPAETPALSPSCSPHHCTQCRSSTSIAQSGPFPPCLHLGPGEPGNTPCPTLLPTIGLGALGQAEGAPRMHPLSITHCPADSPEGSVAGCCPMPEHSSPALLLEERAAPQTKGSWDEGG